MSFAVQNNWKRSFNSGGTAVTTTTSAFFTGFLSMVFMSNYFPLLRRKGPLFRDPISPHLRKAAAVVWQEPDSYWRDILF